MKMTTYCVNQLDKWSFPYGILIFQSAMFAGKGKVVFCFPS